MTHDWHVISEVVCDDISRICLSLPKYNELLVGLTLALVPPRGSRVGNDAVMRAGGSIYFRWSSLAFANLLRVKRHSKSHPGIDCGHMVTFHVLCPYRYGNMSRIDVNLYVRKESWVFSAAR